MKSTAFVFLSIFLGALFLFQGFLRRFFASSSSCKKIDNYNCIFFVRVAITVLCNF